MAQDSSANVKTQVFNVSTPFDMLGKAVTMYVKKTTILADSTVYGAPVVSDVNTVIETGEKVTGGDSKDDDSLAALLKALAWPRIRPPSITTTMRKWPLTALMWTIS